MKRPFKSGLAPLFEEFVLSRKAARRWNASYEENLHFFDNYCADKYPGQTHLSEEMLDWCKERPTEHGNSCRYRITVVCNFVRHANQRGWTHIAPPDTIRQKPCTYIPHAFTEEELKIMFEECDRQLIKAYNHAKSMDNRLNKLELPVYIRLLLSSGMRTNEARWLERTDVNLEDGVININQSKGIDQHRVALHPSMTEILRKYDKSMGLVMPNRRIFFPDRNDKPHRPAWADYHFRNIWKEVSTARARLYDLRSHYAVTNVTRWKGFGYEIHEKLVHLSRSMGHRDISSTYWYFNLSPGLADKLQACCEDKFNQLLPDLSDYGTTQE